MVPYSEPTMSDPPDWEERCALALLEIDRTDLDATAKLTRVRQLLNGEADATESDQRAHAWQETAVEPLDGTDPMNPGQSIRYRCKQCGAVGHRIVFPTSVTLYPIVSERPYCGN